MGPRRGPTGDSPSRCPWMTRNCGHRRGRHRKMRFRDLQAGSRFHRRDRGDRRRPPDGAEMASLSAVRSARRWPTAPCLRSLPELRVSRRRRPRQHVPVQARLRAGVLRDPRPRSGATAQRRTSELRPVAGGQQGENPARVRGGDYASAPRRRAVGLSRRTSSPCPSGTWRGSSGPGQPGRRQSYGPCRPPSWPLVPDPCSHADRTSRGSRRRLCGWRR